MKPNSTGYGDELVEIFLKAGILTPEQVQHARRVSSKIETNKPLTVLFQELNYITHDQILNALEDIPISMPLGNLLVELGHIGQTDLKLALDIQANDNLKRDLDKVLIDQALLDEKTLLQTKALKVGLPYIDSDFSEIDRTLLSMAPVRWFSAHRLIPVRREANGVRIAFVDP